jgi:outer membrane protein W
MKKVAYIFIALICICKYSQAQTLNMGKDLFFVGYEMAIPVNANYLTKTSWVGSRFDYQRMITPNVSVGVGVSFNSFNEYFTEQTYQRTDGTGAITSDMIRQIYTAPVTASIHYYFSGEVIRPYIGIGVGTEYSQQNAYFNIYNTQTTNWGFVVRPEIGLTGKLSPYVGIFASAAFNYATNKNDAFHIDHLSQIPITAGFIFTAP